MAHQIRQLMGELNVKDLSGEVEVDETYVGGYRAGESGRGAEGKTIVLGVKERQGKVKTEVVPDAKRETIEPIVLKKIEPGSKVHTDEWWAYRKLGQIWL